MFVRWKLVQVCQYQSQATKPMFHKNPSYDISIYEDCGEPNPKISPQLRGIVKKDGVPDIILCTITEDAATGLKFQNGEDPVDFLLERIKEEIDAGHFSA